MRGHFVRPALLASILALVGSTVIPAQAIHWYRGPGSGCTPAAGALSDDPAGTTTNITQTVTMGHNTFSAGVSGFDPVSVVQPVETRIKAGQSVQWTWNSSHCHSVTSTAQSGDARVFDSGFHYPEAPPESPQVAPGAFDYPLLDETPTLTYTRTFPTPGTYSYFCVHHSAIGMNGVVIVEP